MALVMVMSSFLSLFIFGGKNVSAFSDPASISDGDFFGEWDAVNSVWIKTGKLNYSYSPALASVEALVKLGDYNGASSALQSYYHARTDRTVMPILYANRNKPYADLTADYIFNYPASGEKFVGDLIVGNTPGTVSMDVTNAVRDNYQMGTVTFVLMARYKDPVVTTFNSKESVMLPPKIEVTIGGSTTVLTAAADAYIRPGAYADTNFGSETGLEVSDQGLPFNDDTRRTYIRFDLSSLATQPDSVSLKLFGGNNSVSGDQTISVYQFGDSSWTESSLKWSNTKSQTFSWQGSSAGTDWNQPSGGADIEWLNLIVRFPFARDMTAEYLATSNEFYANSLLTIMLDFINDKGATGGYTRSIDTGLRALEWLRAYHYFTGSASMDAAANKAILKYMWQMGDYLQQSANFSTNSNWGIIETRGLYFLSVYFPELAASAAWTQTAKDRVDLLISNLIYGDGSYLEHSSQYTDVALSGLLDFKKMADLNGQSLGAVYDQALIKLARYSMDQAHPDGTDPQYGDSDYPYSHRGSVKSVGEFYGIGDLTYFGTGGASGTAPSYTSTLYPNKKEAMMRTGWNDQDLYLHVNNGAGNGIHKHPDNLAVMAYGYGNRLLIDPGRYSYDGNSAIGNWIRNATEAHNTITVNDANQSSLAEGTIDNWAANSGFDFFSGSVSSTYPGLDISRSILFIKPNYWIVSDAVFGDNASKKYKQTWHMLPTANATLDPSTGKTQTHFNTGGNLQIVPADPASLTALLDDGYYSSTYMAASPAKYTSYVKNEPGNVTFDTVLYPTDAGQTSDVRVTRLTTSPSVPSSVATALQIDLNYGNGGNIGYYYLSQEKTPVISRGLADFNFNGKMVYAETAGSGSLTRVALNQGKALLRNGADLIRSRTAIEDLSVTWSGADLDLASNPNSGLIADNVNVGEAVAIYAPLVTDVRLNGVSIPFARSGDYIYAVRQLDRQQYLLKDTFEDNAASASPAGWAVTTESGTGLAVYADQVTGNKSVRLTDSGTSGSSIMVKRFLPQRGMMELEWRFKEEGASGKWPSFALLSGTTRAIQLLTADGSVLRYRDGAGIDHTIQSVSPDKWYTVKVIANIYKNTYDVYVDGTLMATALPFRSAAQVIDGVDFRTGYGPTGTLQIDDVTVKGFALINDNFDAGVTGQSPAGWQTALAANTDVQIAGVSDGVNKSVKLTDQNSAGKAVITKRFYRQTGTVTAEWRFKETVAGQWPTFTLLGGSTEAVKLFSASGTGLSYRDASGDHVIQAIANEQWYDVRVTANLATAKFDVYVNEQLKASGISFSSAASFLDEIEFATGYGPQTSGLYVDQVKVGGTQLLNETFNSMTAGNAPTGWKVSGVYNTSATVANVPSSTDKSLKLEDASSAGFVSATKTIAANDQITTVEWKFKEPIAGRWAVFTLYGDVAPAVQLYTKDGPKLAYLDNRRVLRDLQSIASDTWYSVKIVANVADSTYDIYVNGVAKATGLAFMNKISSIENIEFRTGYGPTGTLYVDDVQICK